MRYLRGSEDGFTLTELLVVVAIIAVLVSAAAATYVGARNRAYNTAAQASLRDAIVSADLVISDYEGQIPATGVLMTELAATAPDIIWVGGSQNAELREVSVHRSNGYVTMSSGSPTGDCFFTRVYVDLSYDKHRTTATNCPASDGASVANPSGW